MAFWKYERKELLQAFSHKKATLKEDLSLQEIKAINSLGMLKHAPELYLGQFLRHFFIISKK